MSCSVASVGLPSSLTRVSGPGRRSWWPQMLAEEWPNASQRAVQRAAAASAPDAEEGGQGTAPVPPGDGRTAPAAGGRPASAPAKPALVAAPAATHAPVPPATARPAGPPSARPGAVVAKPGAGASPPRSDTEPQRQARLGRIGSSKIDDVLRRYSPRRNPQYAAAAAPGAGHGRTVELPQNWATEAQALKSRTNAPASGQAALRKTPMDESNERCTSLEKENEALRQSLGLLEENASLRRRIESLEAQEACSG